MAVELECGPITSFDDWYVDRKEDVRTGLLEYRSLSEDGMKVRRRYEDFKREMDARCQDFDKLERLADGEVISPLSERILGRTAAEDVLVPGSDEVIVRQGDLIDERKAD